MGYNVGGAAIENDSGGGVSMLRAELDESLAAFSCCRNNYRRFQRIGVDYN